MTDDRLREIEDRASKATAEPFELIRYEHGGGRFYQQLKSATPNLIADFYDEGNREFYVDAHNAVLELLAEVRRLRAELSSSNGNQPQKGMMPTDAPDALKAVEEWFRLPDQLRCEQMLRKYLGTRLEPNAIEPLYKCPKCNLGFANATEFNPHYESCGASQPVTSVAIADDVVEWKERIASAGHADVGSLPAFQATTPQPSAAYMSEVHHRPHDPSCTCIEMRGTRWLAINCPVHFKPVPNQWGETGQ